MLRRALFTKLVFGFAALAIHPVYGSERLMQIQKVIGGVYGEELSQAIQLRMRADNQNQLQDTRLVAYDANGENPFLIIDFTQSVPNGTVGSTVLIATPIFRSVTEPRTEPDFIVRNWLIPPDYLDAGSLTLEDDSGSQVWWRLSWGGANYRGSTSGSTANDPDGEFGPPYPGALPRSGSQALEFTGPATALSSSNLEDYALSVADAVFTNNAGQDFTVFYDNCGFHFCPGDPNCDGFLNSGDIDAFFLALGDPEQWRLTYPSRCSILCACDINRDGVLNGGDIDAFFVVIGLC